MWYVTYLHPNYPIPHSEGPLGRGWDDREWAVVAQQEIEYVQGWPCWIEENSDGLDLLVESDERIIVR